MSRYIFMKLLFVLPALGLVLTMVFLLAHIVPGDPVEQMLGEGASAEDLAGLRHSLGLDHMANIAGVSGDTTRPDNIVFDIKANPYGGTGISTGGYGHPPCVNTTTAYQTLPPVIP